MEHHQNVTDASDAENALVEHVSNFTLVINGTADSTGTDDDECDGGLELLLLISLNFLICDVDNRYVDDFAYVEYSTDGGSSYWSTAAEYTDFEWK